MIKTPGLRKAKKPTAKQLETLNNRLELQNAMLKLEIRDRTANLLTQMQVFEGIFISALDAAATIGEARRWFSEWSKDINSLPIDDPDHNGKIQAIIDKHGFEITIKNHHADIDEMWEKSRNEEQTTR